MSTSPDLQLIQQRMEQAVTDALIRQSRYITPSSQTKRTRLPKKTERNRDSQQLDIIRSVRNITRKALQRTAAEITQENIAKSLYPSPSPTWGRSKKSAVPPLTKEQARYLCKNTMDHFYLVDTTFNDKHRKYLQYMKEGHCFYSKGTDIFISVLAWSFIRYNVFPSLNLSDFDFFVNNVTPDLISLKTILEYPDITLYDKRRISMSEQYIQALSKQILELQSKKDINEMSMDQINSLQTRINRQQKKVTNLFEILKSSYKFDKIAVIQMPIHFSEIESSHSMLVIINPFIEKYVILDSNGMKPLKNYQRTLINYIKTNFESIGFPLWEFKYYPRVKLQYEEGSCGMWSLWMGIMYLMGNYRECFYVKHKQDEQVNEFTKNIAAAISYCLPMKRNVMISELCELLTECDSNLFINWETLKEC